MLNKFNHKITMGKNRRSNTYCISSGSSSADTELTIPTSIFTVDWHTRWIESNNKTNHWDNKEQDGSERAREQNKNRKKWNKNQSVFQLFGWKAPNSFRSIVANLRWRIGIFVECSHNTMQCIWQTGFTFALHGMHTMKKSREIEIYTISASTMYVPTIEANTISFGA